MASTRSFDAQTPIIHSFLFAVATNPNSLSLHVDIQNMADIPYLSLRLEVASAEALDGGIKQ